MAYHIDSKMGLGTKAHIKNANEQIVLKAKGRMFNVPRKMAFTDFEGHKVAELRAHISPIKSRLTMNLANGDVWKLEGNLLGKTYRVSDGQKDIIVIDEKWVSLRDKYFVEIDEAVSLPLELGLIWAVDIWREGKGN